MFTKVAQQIDAIPMYRIVTLALVWLVFWSLLLGLLGYIRYGFVEQAISLAVVVVVAFASNVALAKLRRIAAHHESALITALLLFFIAVPAASLNNSYQVAIDGWLGWSLPSFFYDQIVIIMATTIAIASKFLLVIRGQHVFNAAALGAVALSVTGIYEFTWWIGTPELFIPLLIAGLVVVHKIRKWEMVGAFLLVSFIVFMYGEWQFEQNLSQSVSFFFLSYSTLFLAFFMLTEPFTTPPTRRLQIFYGAVTGWLAHSMLFVPYFSMSPELALVIANAIFFPATLRRKLFLTYQSHRKIAADTYEFVFTKPAGLIYQPGQYLEWELAHSGMDKRGQRRYFTIASSPTEPDVRLGLKILPENGSSYKAALKQLQSGDRLVASQRAGDFLLPKDTKQKLGFIAGGIGITPFRCFAQYMLDTRRTSDTVLYYCNSQRDEVAYRDVFANAAQSLSWKNVYMLANDQAVAPEEKAGYITADLLKQTTPDYTERVWYLSGPPGMVTAYEKLLRELGVPRRQIMKDFFPGLA